MDFSFLQKMGMAGGVGGIGAGLGTLFGGSKNPYDDASKYYDQIPGTIKPYMQPYIDQGQQAGGQAFNQFQRGVNDPSSVMNQLGAGYHQSPGFQFGLHNALNGVNNQAAAGGMLGSPSAMYNSANMANGLANQDYYNYISQGLGQYNQGLQGLSGMNQLGYQASDNLAGGLANSLMNQGNQAFSGTAAQNQKQGAGMGDLIGGAAQLAAFIPW